MRALAILAATALAACSPQIDAGTYFCGPERFCPPGLACDEPTYTCDAPSLADRFACPELSEMFEPDDTAAQAHELGESGCGETLISGLLGCVVADDVDLVAFEYRGECAGADPHLEASLRFPVAFALLSLELVDQDGAVIATGELCTPPGDRSGREYVCLEARPPSGRYLLRIKLGAGPDCDGECRHSQYFLDVSALLS